VSRLCVALAAAARTGGTAKGMRHNGTPDVRSWQIVFKIGVDAVLKNFFLSNAFRLSPPQEGRCILENGSGSGSCRQASRNCDRHFEQLDHRLTSGNRSRSGRGYRLGAHAREDIVDVFEGPDLHRCSVSQTFNAGVAGSVHVLPPRYQNAVPAPKSRWPAL
jgi:hypothetical protein